MFAYFFIFFLIALIEINMVENIFLFSLCPDSLTILTNQHVL